jgi:hypothetical protein
MTAMDKHDLSHARTYALWAADALHLAYHDELKSPHWQSQAKANLEQMAYYMGYTITPKTADLTRHNQTIDAAGMGGNGFAGAEYAAHVLTVAMRNGGA